MPSQSEEPVPHPEDWGYDLLMFGNDHILRASDVGVLVAFAAIAFQNIRDDKLAHYHVGLGFLLFSVFLCVVVHFAIGSAYVGQARRLIRGQQETWRAVLVRRTHTTLACSAGILQLFCILVGLLLVLLPEPPAILQEYLLKYFN